LVFNFHNLFGKGFPFSRIYGDYVIDRGIASTKGLRIESSVANIKLTGPVNLAAGPMAQRAEISPNYFGSLPVIAAIVGGLGIGAVVYAITKLFGSPLAALTKLHYTISGPIRDPVVKPLGNAPPLKPQPHVQSPPAAASGAAPARGAVPMLRSLPR
ncbi:MAG TPA: AsmA-like C-terminal region-containing protein, partial [Gammaproteobacteria bacterium]|nr:AsmA-like C-terminal region-containing protein [Gammaproteobacteria bacterium]